MYIYVYKQRPSESYIYFPLLYQRVNQCSAYVGLTIVPVNKAIGVNLSFSLQTLESYNPTLNLCTYIFLTFAFISITLSNIAIKSN